MADTVVKIKRTAVTGRAANTTTLPNAGELGLNMTDGILYSTNGSVVFEIGANLTSLNVTGPGSFGNSTVNTQIGTGQVNTDIIQLGVAAYVGANVDITATGWVVGNTIANTYANATTLYASFGHSNPNTMPHSYTFAAAINTVIAGPYTIPPGNTMTIATGSRVVIV